MTDLVTLLSAVAKRIEQNKLYSFLPYGHPDTLHPVGATWAAKQSIDLWHDWSNSTWQYDFLNSQTSINALFAGNRLGKSEIGAARMAFHATGYYPKWYKGKRLSGNINLWCCAVSSEFSRDVQQQKLLGSSTYESDLFGTGYIPKDFITEKPKYRQAGVSDTIDFIPIRRLDGGIATIYFKSYDQGWRKFGGRDVHHIWADEQPDENNLKESRIFSEICARTWAVNGTIDLTMTPLLSGQNMLKLVRQNEDASIFTASIFDVPHISPEQRKKIITSTDEAERDCRIYGIEMSGSGRVFMVSDVDIIVEPIPIPRHWQRICGIDFGISRGHPAAGAWLAIDRDTDTIYLYDCYKAIGKTVEYQAYAIKSRGDWIPCAWPHDGMRKGNRAEGEILADDYRKHGVNMLTRSARYKRDVGGAQPVEPAFADLNERMLTGRFKVFSTCKHWFDEFRGMYRDDNGNIVARNDDVVKASIYAYMDKRYALSMQVALSKNITPLYSSRAG